MRELNDNARVAGSGLFLPAGGQSSLDEDRMAQVCPTQTSGKGCLTQMTRGWAAEGGGRVRYADDVYVKQSDNGLANAMHFNVECPQQVRMHELCATFVVFGLGIEVKLSGGAGPGLLSADHHLQ